MTRLFTLPGTRRNDPDVDRWMALHPGPLAAIARRWFDVMRQCGGDVREVMHDGQPTACVGDAAFAYVDAFKAHVNVGFFGGADLPDPAGLLQGNGRFMRHVKLVPGVDIDDGALVALVRAAYVGVKHARTEV